MVWGNRTSTSPHLGSILSEVMELPPLDFRNNPTSRLFPFEDILSLLPWKMGCPAAVLDPVRVHAITDMCLPITQWQNLVLAIGGTE